MISLLLQSLVAQDCTVPQINTRVGFPDLTSSLRQFYQTKNISLKDEGTITKKIQNVTAAASVPVQTVTPVFKDGKLQFTYNIHVKFNFHTKTILPTGGINNATKQDVEVIVTLSPSAQNKGLTSSQTYKNGSAAFIYQINKTNVQDDADLELALKQYIDKQATQGPKTFLNSKIQSIYLPYLSQLVFTSGTDSLSALSLPTVTIQQSAVHLAETASINGNPICAGQNLVFQAEARTQQLQIHRAAAQSLRVKGNFNRKFDKSWIISKFFFSCYEMTEISQNFINTGICKFLTDRVTVECSVDSGQLKNGVVSSTQTCSVLAPSSGQQQAKPIFIMDLSIDYNWQYTKNDELVHLLSNPVLKNFDIKVPDGATYAIDNPDLAKYFVNQALLTINSPIDLMHSKFPTDFKQAQISIENDVLKFTIAKAVQK